MKKYEKQIFEIGKTQCNTISVAPLRDTTKNIHFLQIERKEQLIHCSKTLKKRVLCINSVNEKE